MDINYQQENELLKKRVEELERYISQIEVIEQINKNSKDQFRFLAETIPQLVWLTDAQGWHDYFNQRWYNYTGMTLL